GAISLACLMCGVSFVAGGTGPYGDRAGWLERGGTYSSLSTDDFPEAFVTEVTIVPTPTDGGIREVVPDKYRSRYDAWKQELLSTPFGKDQWENYALDKKFVLTIVVSQEKGKGAGTDKLEWDDKGNLVGATVTLGSEIDTGYPAPIYYPVLNSLSSDQKYSVNGHILAATKFVHEIGHVNQAKTASVSLIQLQNRLIPQYNSIMLKNGYNGSDKRLQDIATQMHGTPLEIWEAREYASEVNAMLYLASRIQQEEFYCHVFKKMRTNVESYAPEFEDRFLAHTEFSSSPCWR
ncbi:MAG: hypothetical protein ACJ73D_03560, partial [Pyrinomonadaceae bacterium]